MDPECFQELSGLSGKVISLEFINTDLTIYLFPHAEGIGLKNSYEGDVHVRVRGTPADMLAFLVSSENNSSLSPNMEIIGDVGLAQQFQQIMKRIDIDWEEQLSHWVGDTLAHKLGNAVTGMLDFAKETKKTLELDVSEYLRYEKEVLPVQSEVDQFTCEVDKLRNDAERLKVRLDKLNQSIDLR